LSENRKSFWSSIPGLVTGLAGLLTGIVGLVTVLIQLDVIGGDSNTANPAVATTVAPAPSGTGAGAGVSTTVSGRLTVDPAAIKFQATEREKTVTVRNNATATVTVLEPEYTGTDRTAFRSDSGCTNVALRVGASCTMKITLIPSGPLKTYRASLTVEAKEIPQQVTEVPIEGVALL
jgi:hypothetical protein